MSSLFKRVFWPDTHCPLHDPRAVDCAMDITRSIKPQELVFLGDFQDCAAVSKHSKTPDVEWRSLQDELAEGIELMHEIVRKVGARRVVYLCGNHERRIKRYIDDNANKLTGLLDVRKTLGIPKNWTYYPYGQGNFHQCGNSGVIAVHGSLLGQHPAKSHLNKYKCKGIIFGHTHRLQAWYETDVHGDTYKSISSGHLGDTRKLADYVDSVANWQQGLTSGYFKRSGRHFLEITEIQNGEGVANGRSFDRRHRRGEVV